MVGRRKNTESSVWERINTHGNDPEVCWEWTGPTAGRDNRGYMNLNGRRQLAYRLVYKNVFGHLPDDMVVRHKCDNEICCNPKHLELGTRGQNEDDKYARDRAGYTNDMIKEMRRVRKLGMSYKSVVNHINDKFGTKVSISGVQKVCTEKRRTQNA